MTGIRAYFGGMTLILLVISCLLGVLLYQQWRQPLTIGDVQTEKQQKISRSDSKDRAASPRSFKALPISSFSEITQRPLFVEGRVPPEQPVAKGPSKSPRTPLNLKLEGVAITPDSKTAVIMDLTSKELLRLREGMSHKDWKVVSVERETVKINRGKQELTLILEIDANPGARKPKPKSKPPFRRSVRRPVAVPNQ
ncbi:MAG: hypothetical protein KZQ93_19680 [Candidatus Thiodiazotropha sp. (ex Monitilora ramsayi)]|nr:hypothetical protein [Candidatus Thiodiazotropha sp. (ex Monitilora ramsayi)]